MIYETCFATRFNNPFCKRGYFQSWGAHNSGVANCNLIYKFTWSSRLWRDVLLHNHFLCFWCETDHREKHFRLELASPGNSFDFYTTVRPSVHPSVCDRAFRPVNGLCDADSATPHKWAAKTDPATYLLFFLIFFLDFFFQKNLRLRICFFFYLFFVGLKNKKRNGQKNVRLRICFFFYLFFFGFVFLDFFPLLLN